MNPKKLFEKVKFFLKMLENKYNSELKKYLSETVGNVYAILVEG